MVHGTQKVQQFGKVPVPPVLPKEGVFSREVFRQDFDDLIDMRADHVALNLLPMLQTL